MPHSLSYMVASWTVQINLVLVFYSQNHQWFMSTSASTHIYIVVCWLKYLPWSQHHPLFLYTYTKINVGSFIGSTQWRWQTNKQKIRTATLNVYVVPLLNHSRATPVVCLYIHNAEFQISFGGGRMNESDRPHFRLCWKHNSFRISKLEVGLPLTHSVCFLNHYSIAPFYGELFESGFFFILCKNIAC